MLIGEIIVGRRCLPAYDKARVRDDAVLALALTDAHHVPALSGYLGRRESE